MSRSNKSDPSWLLGKTGMARRTAEKIKRREEQVMGAAGAKPKKKKKKKKNY